VSYLVLFTFLSAIQTRRKVNTNMGISIDLKRIDPLMLKENYLLGLMFPSKGLIPLRIKERELVTWRYDQLGTLTADEWSEAAKLDYNTASVTNILEVDKVDELIHLFYGIGPSELRSYLNYPVDTARRRLPEVARTDKMNMGFVDGFESPLDNPSPLSEVFIPKDIDVGFAWWNPCDYDIKAILQLIANRYRFEVITDVDLIMSILANRKECRIATMGGLQPVQYDYNNVFGMEPIPLGSGRDVVVDAVGGV
tara:strand:- start:3854 stop:4612 length:759 start_codon:yes stop_codon:yes gene_type:complete